MALPPPTTTLPTEPGLYLFRGVYSPRHARAHGSGRREVEIVRVVRTTTGRLTYVGADFIYLEDGAPIGAWVRLDPLLGELAAVADDALHAHLATKVPETLREWSYGQPWTRDGALKKIARPFEPSTLTEGALDKAIALGLVHVDAAGQICVPE